MQKEGVLIINVFVNIFTHSLASSRVRIKHSNHSPGVERLHFVVSQPSPLNAFTFLRVGFYEVMNYFPKVVHTA